MTSSWHVGRVAATWVLLLGCADEGRDGGWQMMTDTIGDTIVVRTLTSGETPALELVEELRIGVVEGPDEEIFGAISGLAVDTEGAIHVLDRQVPVLRKYGPDGEHQVTLGGQGAGPGEYTRPDGGPSVLGGGRVILRDPGNGRFTLFNPDGTFDTTWPHQTTHSTSRPIYVDTAGYVYNVHIRTVPSDQATSGSMWLNVLVKYAPDGTPLDSIPVPDSGYETPMLTAELTTPGGTSRSTNSVPFSPAFVWTFSPLGYYVTGTGAEYGVDLHRPEGVLRISRDAEPVRVRAGEKADAEDRVTRGMRNTDPQWEWNGPPIPDTKPAHTTLLVAEDGRVWVRVAVPAIEIEQDPAEVEAAREENRRPPPKYREPIVFDVFEPDGSYFGQVRMPEGFSMSPQPVIRGDRVWAVVRDELGVNYIVRFRVVEADGS